MKVFKGGFKMIDILIKNAIIVTVNKDRDVIFDGAIAIQGDRILDIGNTVDIEPKYLDDQKSYRC